MISLKGRIAATLLSGALKLLPNLVASSSSSMSRVVRRVAVHLRRIQPHVHVLPFKDRTKKHRQRNPIVSAFKRLILFVRSNDLFPSNTFLKLLSLQLMVPLLQRSHTFDFLDYCIQTLHGESQQKFAKSDNKQVRMENKSPSWLIPLVLLQRLWPSLASWRCWLMSAKVKYCKEKIHQQA